MFRNDGAQLAAGGGVHSSRRYHHRRTMSRWTGEGKSWGDGWGIGLIGVPGSRGRLLEPGLRVVGGSHVPDERTIDVLVVCRVGC